MAMSHFVCLYYSNTGSSWLVDALNTSTEVFVPGFEPLERWGWEGPDEDKAGWIRNAFSIPPVDERHGAAWQAWIDGIRVAASAANARPGTHHSSVGFKMTWWAFDDRDVLISTLASLPVKTIVLTRENRLKHALSLYRYRDEQKSQFEKGGVKPPTELDMARFGFWLRESQRHHDMALEYELQLRAYAGDDRVFALTYEEFVSPEGKQDVTERLARYLELDPALISGGKFDKATPDSLREAVVNYRRLHKRYRGTPYEVYLDE